MTVPNLPRLRSLEIFPVGEAEEGTFALRDPEGFSHTTVLPLGAAILASLMDGSRSLAKLQTDFAAQAGHQPALADIEVLIGQLDEAYFLESERFELYRRTQVDAYLGQAVRPAAHAGGAYEGEPDALRKQLAALFTCEEGPGAPDDGAFKPGTDGKLCGVLSPHIDLHRGGPAFAWAYKTVVEKSDADLFVVFGTAHSAMRNLFGVSRKHFDTPLGTVETDGAFIDALVENLQQSAGTGDTLLADEMAHRNEHSIEFQALFLQYLLGERRSFKIVPVLTGSFQSFIARGSQPNAADEVANFVAAMRKTERDYDSKICYISGGDLAHIGRRFGDEELLGEDRLSAQSDDDRALLDAACRADSAAFFDHVANQNDRSRICGLAPTYTMMEIMQPERGEFLKYDQAVEPDGTSCVSFASLAFYRE